MTFTDHGGGDVAPSLAEAAAWYASRGLFVFPLVPRGKEPLVKGGGGFLSASNDVELVRQRWQTTPNANIGLWPGPSGLVVIDEDGPEGIATGERLGAHTVPTLECTTGREDGGRHLYFRRPLFTLSNVALGTKLDCRCDGGYVILPRSIHPSGRPYRWTSRGRPLAELPTALLEAMRAAKERVETPPVVLTTAPLTTGEATDRRVRGYMARIGSLGEGAGRNNAAYQFAAWLTRDLALDSPQALAYVNEWNAGNLPPLPSRELQRTFASAVKHARRSRGCALAEPAPLWRFARPQRPRRLPSGQPPRPLSRGQAPHTLGGA